MGSTLPSSSPGKIARVAGILYLLLFFLGPFSFFYIPSQFHVAGDGVASLAKIVENSALFRGGIISESLIFLTEIVLTVLLYLLLRPAGKGLALVAVIARLMQSGIQGVNLFTSATALNIANGGALFSGLDAAQLGDLTLLALQGHESGVMISQFFFGFHCTVLGILLMRAEFLPKWIGILIFIASFGYLIDAYGYFIAPQYADIYAMIVAIPAVVSELSLTLWLLIKKVDEDIWHQKVAQQAV
ncbi:DUF4386 domain-containing protein [bacterium]|nr:DUF4386 domain-containing protein [bacterium]